MPADQDASAITSAIANNIDTKKLIEIIPNRTSAQMQEIRNAYKSLKKSELPADIEKSVPGEVGYCLANLCKSPIDYDLDLIEEAINGPAIKEGVLLEVLIRKSNNDMKLLNKTFQARGNVELKDFIGNKTSGYLNKLFLLLLEANRDEAGTRYKVTDDAVALYNAGEGKIGTDKDVFVEIFATRSDDHLRNVFAQYEQDYKKTIDKVLESEILVMGGLELALISIYKILENAAQYAAAIIESAVSGVGTNERRLSRALIRYRGPFIQHVKISFDIAYERSLKKRLVDDTSGDYQALLLQLINEKVA